MPAIASRGGVTGGLAAAFLLRAPRTVSLVDGSTGYFVRRPDDCWRAALATCLQIPPDQIPDANLDERVRRGEDPEEIDRSAWQQEARWLAGRGLRMVAHRKVPVARSRWIGVVPNRGLFNDHTMVMAWDEVLFDPAADFDLVSMTRLAELFGRPAPTIRVRSRMWGPDDVDRG